MAVKIEFQFVTLSLLTNGAILLKKSLSANYADGGNRNSSIYVTMIIWGVGFSDRGPKPVVPNRNP